jgi:hypothetical protein
MPTNNSIDIGTGSSSQVLTSNGTGVAPTFQGISATGAFDSVNVQVFTSSGTYTPTSGMKYCVIECVGGGGAGGGGASTGPTTVASGGGGGGGGYSRGFFSSATIGASQTVTIGSGGTAGTVGNNAGNAGTTTSVGSLITATAGGGGAGSPASTVSIVNGAGGGNGSGGSFSCYGTTGFPGISFYSSVTGDVQ